MSVKPASDRSAPLSPDHGSRRRRWRRARQAAIAVAVVLSTIWISSVVSAPAQAYIYAGGGNFGPYVTPTVSCQWKIYGTSSNLVMSAAAPSVYAYNYTAGGGNDSAWVRYRVFVVNANTGATLAVGGYNVGPFGTSSCTRL